MKKQNYRGKRIATKKISVVLIYGERDSNFIERKEYISFDWSLSKLSSIHTKDLPCRANKTVTRDSKAQ